MSLLKNAAQSIEGEGEIEIFTTSHEGSVTIQIRDTGKGIPPERLARIFDFGFNAAEARIKMGFGLPTAYKTVQEHKGEIEIQSELGKGTAVTVTLPARKRDA